MTKVMREKVDRMLELTMGIADSESITEWLIANAEGEGETGTFIHDIAIYGCSGGIPGLTYYQETSEFYDRHRKEIWKMMEELDLTVADIIQPDPPTSHAQFANALAWWAVERRAVYLVDVAELKAERR